MEPINWIRYGRESLNRRTSSKVVTGLIEELGACDVKAEIHSVLNHPEIELDEIVNSGEQSCSDGAEAVEYIHKFLSDYLEKSLVVIRKGFAATNPHCSYRSRGESRRIVFGDTMEWKLNLLSTSLAGDSKYYKIEIISKDEEVPSVQTYQFNLLNLVFQEIL